MPAPPTPLRRKYTFIISTALLIGLLALLAYVTHTARSERERLLRLAQVDTQRLLGDLERSVATARNHLHSMQYVSRAAMDDDARIDLQVLNRYVPNRYVPTWWPEASGFPFDALPSANQTGSLIVRSDVVGPVAGFVRRGPLTEELARRFGGMVSIMEVVAAGHAHYPMLAWSYYYDVDHQFAWNYPGPNRFELLRSTGASSADQAIEVIFDADGTRPVESMSPAANPRRLVRWTRAYTDAGGKGAMVTLLAPVDVHGHMRGVVGADITLKEMASMLDRARVMPFHVLVVNEHRQVLFDSHARQPATGGMVFADQVLGRDVLAVPLNDRFQPVGDVKVLSYQVPGSGWRMLAVYPHADLERQIRVSILPAVEVSLAVVLILGAVLYVVHARYAQPALRLALYLEALKKDAGAPVPDVPAPWRPRFEDAAQVEQQRRQLLQSLQQNAEDLELRVAQRTAELEGSNQHLNEALDTLRRTQRQLIDAEKHAALSTLVAGVAHDLNTPIGTSLTVATTMSEKTAEFERLLGAGGLKRSALTAFIDDCRNASRILSSNLFRAADLVASFKHVAVDQASEHRRDFQLRELLHSIELTMRSVMRNAPVVLDIRQVDEVTLDSYPGALSQVLINLINNALLHAFGGRDSGRIEVSAQALGDEQVRLVVRDDGKGIPPELQRQVFEPFFTTRMGQGGSGLGLTIVRNITTNVLGGQVQLDSTPGQGATFTIDIPLRAPAGQPPAAV